MFKKYLPAMVIGCGGTGIRTLRFLQALGGDDYDKPLGDMIKQERIVMLGMDTDPKSNDDEEVDQHLVYRASILKKNQERCPTRLPILKNFIRIQREEINNAMSGVFNDVRKIAESGIPWHQWQDNHLHHHSVAEWFPMQNPEKGVEITMGASKNAGAAQWRPLGRVGLFNQFNEIKSSLIEAQEKVAKAAGSGAEFNAYIVCSLAGGTGSSMFWDISILLNMINPRIRTTGIFLLDSPFLGVDKGGRISTNVYAFLKEIAILKNMVHKQRLVVHYPDGSEAVLMPGGEPVLDMVYLYNSFPPGDGVKDFNKSLITVTSLRLAQNLSAQLRRDVHKNLDVSKNNIGGDTNAQPKQRESRFAFSTSFAIPFPEISFEHAVPYLQTLWLKYRIERHQRNEELGVKALLAMLEASEISDYSRLFEEKITQILHTVTSSKIVFFSEQLEEINKGIENLDQLAGSEIQDKRLNDIFLQHLPTTLVKQWFEKGLQEDKPVDAILDIGTSTVGNLCEPHLTAFTEGLRKVLGCIHNRQHLSKELLGLLSAWEKHLDQIKPTDHSALGLRVPTPPSFHHIKNHLPNPLQGNRAAEENDLLIRGLRPSPMNKKQALLRIFNHVKEILENTRAQEFNSAIHQQVRRFFFNRKEEYQSELVAILKANTQLQLTMEYDRRLVTQFESSLQHLRSDWNEADPFQELEVLASEPNLFSENHPFYKSLQLFHRDLGTKLKRFLETILKDPHGNQESIQGAKEEKPLHDMIKDLLYPKAKEETSTPNDALGYPPRETGDTGKATEMAQGKRIIQSLDYYLPDHYHLKDTKTRDWEPSYVQLGFDLIKDFMGFLAGQVYAVRYLDSGKNNGFQELISRAKTKVFREAVLEQSIQTKYLVVIPPRLRQASEDERRLRERIQTAAIKELNCQVIVADEPTYGGLVYFEDLFHPFDEIEKAADYYHHYHVKSREERPFFHFDRRVAEYPDVIQVLMSDQPIHCGNPGCTRDLRTARRDLLVCPSCRGPIWNRCGNEDCPAENLKELIDQKMKGENSQTPPYYCPSCQGELVTWWWQCTKDKDHKGKIPADKETCISCMEEYHSGVRALDEVGRKSHHSDQDCPGCMDLEKRQRIKKRMRVELGLLPYFRDGVNGFDSVSFPALVKEFGHDLHYCRERLEPHFLFPTCPREPDSNRGSHHVYRNLNGKFVCTHHPEIRFYTCFHCGYPIDRSIPGSVTKCHRCLRRLMRCPYCSDKYEHFYSPNESRYPTIHRCPKCSNLMTGTPGGSYQMVERGLKKPAYCRNLFACNAGLDIWRTAADYDLKYCHACQEPISPLLDRYDLEEIIKGCPFCLTILGLPPQEGNTPFGEGNMLPDLERIFTQIDILMEPERDRTCRVCGADKLSTFLWIWDDFKNSASPESRAKVESWLRDESTLTIRNTLQVRPKSIRYLQAREIYHALRSTLDNEEVFRRLKQSHPGDIKLMRMLCDQGDDNLDRRLPRGPIPSPVGQELLALHRPNSVVARGLEVRLHHLAKICEENQKRERHEYIPNI
ncbi:MAG: hypothetical protein G8345_04680 [Magnetococcales bacterium]|nr:hypothetical protein [Magnetococcales bacterium]